MNLYVKKLVSLNPDRYEFIEFNEAKYNYYQYAILIKDGYTKTFKEWCDTEI
jgi:hypothetical protein